MGERLAGTDATEIWRGLLLGTDPQYARTRALMRRLPGEPRCKMCAAPFGMPGGLVARFTGRGPWAKNPTYCGKCFQILSRFRGGAEIESSFLFADVRGSTSLAERISPTEFRSLLGRFYETATRVLVDHDAIVDKFVGDEVVAIFIPALAHDAHATRAIEAGLVLLGATGHGEREGPWLPIGVGVHTGVAFVGAVGEPPVTELTALGDVVNTAARLASAAGAGELLLSEAAATSSGRDVRDRERRDLELKGKAATTTVYVERASS